MYACNPCTRAGTSCFVLRDNEEKECTACEGKNAGRPRCNADQVCECFDLFSLFDFLLIVFFSFFFSIDLDGSGEKGLLMARVRRAVWHFVHDGQELDWDGKYPVWNATKSIVNVDLAAVAPDWKPAVVEKDPGLWEEIQAFKARQTDVGEVGKFLAKMPTDLAKKDAWIVEGEGLLGRLKREVARLERNLGVAKADQADARAEEEAASTTAS